MQYDQTNLVHDVLSIHSGFEVTSTTGETLDHDGQHDITDYRWISYDPSQHPVPPEATLSASLTGSHWYAISNAA